MEADMERSIAFEWSSLGQLGLSRLGVDAQQRQATKEDGPIPGSDP
jgi:hypothetical protein